jgi:hypothetical protein
MVSQRQNVAYIPLALLLLIGSPPLGRANESDGITSRYYRVDAQLFSMVPDQGIDTYRFYGSGDAAVNCQLGHVVAGNGRRFDVDIQPALKSRRFMVTVVVKPAAKDQGTEARRIEYDLTDIHPQTLDIARDADGRVYRLNLTPRVIELPKPKQFQVHDLRLERWSFASSLIVLNKQDYLGLFSAGPGELAWCDVPGLAKIEFSLLRLKDSRAWGNLQDGTINITHPDGTTLRISNVMNGVQQQLLEGGPYQVWVRWMKPTHSVEECRDKLRDEIAALKQQEADGDLSFRPEVLQRLEKESESDRPTFISVGFGPVYPADRAPVE